ncbi:MAG: type IV secretory system conjugative DNA transfer family protein, partial [Hyphomonas sp.]|nr:type IV secretory system conjugative DNA transfer family protein [Hyphomonas sp.]
APWLSHMMVSRQETQRQLLTPGEIMQLPPRQEVVMLSGTAPVLAEKLRYFEDRNFTTRVLPPVEGHTREGWHNSDWSGLFAEPACEKPLFNTASDDNTGPEVRHELEREPIPNLDIEESVSFEGDAVPVDPANAQHLDAVRRALALDEINQDIIPEH